MPIPDVVREDKIVTDYSMFLNLTPNLPAKKKVVEASNQDASLLFEIW